METLIPTLHSGAGGALARRRRDLSSACFAFCHFKSLGSFLLLVNFVPPFESILNPLEPFASDEKLNNQQ